jgi:hypothetical protein
MLPRCEGVIKDHPICAVHSMEILKKSNPSQSNSRVPEKVRIGDPIGNRTRFKPSSRTFILIHGRSF